MTMKKVIYTCITGDYDNLKDHGFYHPDYDYICFTDKDIAPVGKWQIQQCHLNNFDGVRLARWHKLHPHLLFISAEESIWIDGNVLIESEEFFSSMNRLAEEEFMRATPHPERTNIFEEYEACWRYGKDSQLTMQNQMISFLMTGWGGSYRNGKFFETNCIYRKHNNEFCKYLMREWWNYIEWGSKRDQLSFTFVLNKNNVNINYLFDNGLRSVAKVERHS